MFSVGQQIGLYTLVRKIGRGGFGEVWLAEKRSHFITKKVAVKLPHDEQVNLEAISQEANLWEAASGHPNVLPIIDADIYDGQVAIVSEYAEGGSLAEKLKTSGKFSIKQAVEVTIGILNGLHYLHSKNIIHRDIKPANILLQGDMPRLADFGISRAMNTSTISSVVVGTEAYMSPESFDGKRNVKTDVWSVGVVLYQMLKGSLPFPQEHPSERMFAILTKEFESLPDNVPQGLRNIVERSLAKEPEKRYQTASQMRDELQSFFSSIAQTTLAQEQSISPSTSKDDEEIETKLRGLTAVTDIYSEEIFNDDETLIDSENILPSSEKPLGYKMTERGMREETGLSTEEPVRGNRESDTYWNTRALTHSILGKHYRTPQANLNILVDFLNSVLSEDRKVIRFSFVAPTSSNLRFFTQNKEIFFNAHQPVNRNDFLKAFGLRDDLPVSSLPKYGKEKELNKSGRENPQYYKFWERLLALGRTKSNIHNNVRPKQHDGICVKNTRGLRFHYVVNKYDGRVEFYIDRGDVDLNKRTFDELLEHKTEIDAVFGKSLSWERLDSRKSCRLGYYFKGGVKSDESEWQSIQTEMIDAMVRLEKSVSPFIPQLLRQNNLGLNTFANRKHQTDKIEIEEPVIAININQSYRDGMTATELYDNTRGIWRLSKERAENAEYAFAVYQEEIKEVYKISEWFQAGFTKYKERQFPLDDLKERYEFVGDVADDNIRDKYVGKLLPEKHYQNPIRYYNC